MLNSKFLVLLVVVLLALVVLYVVGRKSVHQEITIGASPGQVWSVLLDTDSYPDWNPVIILLEGQVQEGNKVKYKFTQDAEQISEIPAIVKQIVPEQLLRQGGGMPVLLTFDHKYILEDTQKGTKLTIHEDYVGIWVNFWNPIPVEMAYGRLGQAIKARAEAL